MIDKTKNKITELLENKLKNNERFKHVTLYCKDNFYHVTGITLKRTEMKEYLEHLLFRTNIGILEMIHRDEYTINFCRNTKLLNGKEAKMYIQLQQKYGVNLMVEYDDKNIDLYKNGSEANSIAVELLMPEIDNVVSTMKLNKREKARE